MPTSTIHDVVIIGSGAGGGMAAHTLTRLGVKCLMLEAGPLFDFQKDRTLVNIPDLAYRGFGQPGRFPHVTQASELDAEAWADEQQNPYTYPKDDPYYWVRIRMVGGKTMRWGRASWRLSDLEFGCKDHDGEGENWPVRLADLAPYYDRAEPMFNVTGRNEGLRQLPDGKILVDESSDSSPIQRFIASCKKLGVPTTKPRRATGTLAASTNILLPGAMETGNLQLVTNAVVREITVDPNTGRANGVRFIDRHSKRDYHVKARTVIVSASTLESCRILLNSTSPRFASGLGNSSGTQGRYLFDQFYVKNTVMCEMNNPRGGGGGYVVRFRNVDRREKNFIRGYTYDFGGGGTPPARYIPQYGEALYKEMDRLRGSSFAMTTMGEVLPKYENHVRINKDVKDAWGIPALHIEQKYGPNEHAMAKDAMEMAEAMCTGAGFKMLGKHAQMVPPGESIHELGTVRMGADPKKSVLNRFNQSHDVKNLFVVDGSSFPSGGAQNPTLTILALSMRASEYLANQMKTGAL